MNTFIYNTPTKVFWDLTLKEVGKIIKEYGYKSITPLWWWFNQKTGLYDRVVKSLEEAGLDFVEMGGVSPNPKVSLVREQLPYARKKSRFIWL